AAPPAGGAAETVHQQDGWAVADGAEAHDTAADPHPRVVDSWTPVDGVSIHSQILGTGRAGIEPVVMLHGLGVSAASLRPLAERLAARRRTVSCDLPGFGRSASERIWTTAEIGNAVGGLLDARGLGPVVLLGHSYGCHVAALVAAARPEQVSAVVFLSPAFDRRFGPPLAQMLLRLTVDATMERPSLVGCGVRDYLRAGPRRVIETLREAADIPLDRLVGGIRSPLLIVRGSRDTLTTTRWAEDLRRSAGGPARVAVVPAAAHALGHEAPVAVSRAMEAFLAAN
ncbi:MAG TPA: alpha/beta hydrolase, partial [Miltoncostaeaceae bacterium]|nr:alpha/beta hydrolase [Miltoncostaeaceae bacterium]